MQAPLSLTKLVRDYVALKEARCVYAWGSKPDPKIEPLSVTDSDCSGFIHYLMVRRIGPGIPAGTSMDQKKWFQDRYESKKYPDVLKYAKHDGGRLFVAGYAIDQPSTNRHIFFVMAGYTMESASGLHGVGSRPAFEFQEEAQWVVELPVFLSDTPTQAMDALQG